MNQPQVRLATHDVSSDSLRQIAMDIEDALERECGCIVDRALARLLSRALWDFADEKERYE
jgi:hypothetical protein